MLLLRNIINYHHTSLKSLLFIPLVIIVVVGIMSMSVLSAHAQSILPVDDRALKLVRENPEEFDYYNGMAREKGSYIVTLKNEIFTSIDEDPKFSNPDEFKPSAIPDKNAQVIPELLHEYKTEVGEIIYDKIDYYNGTEHSSLSPLKIQGGYVETPLMDALRGFTIENVEDISVFVNDPDIAVVEPELVSFLDTQYIPTNVLRVEAHKMASTQYRVPGNIDEFPEIDIAVADTQVSADHPDIIRFRFQEFLPTGSSTYPRGEGDHGTHIAGTIAARDNLGGVVGIIPGARIWSLSVCGSTTNTCTNLVSAINYATANAASIEIFSMSIGRGCGWLCNPSNNIQSSETTAFNNLRSAGVTAVVSAGNDRVSMSNGQNFACGITSVICVSAMADNDGKCGGNGPSVQITRSGTTYTQRDDEIAFFSNFGPAVDIMAPGWDLLSTIPSRGDLHEFTNQRDYPFIGASDKGGYGKMSGTSMATPVVSGAAGVLKLKNPGWSPATILSDMQSKAIDQNTSCDGENHGGLRYDANDRSSEKILNMALY